MIPSCITRYPDGERTGTGNARSLSLMRNTTVGGADEGGDGGLGGVVSACPRPSRSIDALEPKPPCPVSSTSERPSAVECDFVSQATFMTPDPSQPVFYRLR